MSDLSGLTWMPVFTVAALPKTASAGAIAFVKDGRAYVVGSLGALSLQSSGAGTGCLATFNGTVWQIAGTATTVTS